MDDAARILLFSLLAALNPTLLAAVTVMLLLPNPKRLMLGYLLGAYLTSITVGLLIVFELHGSAVVSTTKNTLSPLGDVLIGALLILTGVVLRGRRMQARQQRRRARREAGSPRKSLPERLLGRGDARIAFCVGILLSFPGASYLAALTSTSRLDVAGPWLVLIVLGICVVQQALLEGPVVAYALRPQRAQRAITTFRAWLARNGRRVGANLAVGLGLLLWVRAAVVLIVG